MLNRTLCFSDCWIFMNLGFRGSPFSFWFFFYRSHNGGLKLVGVVGCRCNDFFVWNASTFAVDLYFLEKLSFLAFDFRDTLFLHRFDGHVLFINVFFLFRLIVDWVVWVPFFTLDKVIINVDDFRLLIIIIRIRLYYWVKTNSYVILCVIRQRTKVFHKVKDLCVLL